MSAAASAAEQALLNNALHSLIDCILFRGIDRADCEALITRARLRQFDAGETIFLMGSPGSSMMMVLAGEVRISVPSPDGREVVLAILREGQYFGEMAMLDGKERTADARALTPCTLAVLERRDMLALFERHPQAWSRMVEVLCERLRATDQHVAEIALLKLPTRLAKVLLRTARPDNSQLGRATAISLSQRELGALVGATRESVNRCLREWQRCGVVRVDNNAITLLDWDMLADMADQD